MDPARFKQLDSLLQSVLERPPEDRDAFLREACGGDRGLEQELRALVNLDSKRKNSWIGPRSRWPR